jgi:hypothetical protein
MRRAFDTILSERDGHLAAAAVLGVECAGAEVEEAGLDQAACPLHSLCTCPPLLLPRHRQDFGSFFQFLWYLLVVNELDYNLPYNIDVGYQISFLHPPSVLWFLFLSASKFSSISTP